MTEKENQVRKRAVFYLSGYDPRGARHYHELYRNESAKQGELAGYASKVGARRRTCKNVVAWDITFQKDGAEEVETQYHFLDYSEVIRKSWRSFELGLYKEMLVSYLGIGRIYWDQWKAGNLRPCWKYSWPITLAATLPFFIILILLMISLLLGWLVYAVVPASEVIRGSAAVLTFILAVLYGRVLDKKLNQYWLLRSLSFIGFEKYMGVDGAGDLWDDFADVVYQATQHDQFDEVLLVGHSVGSVIGVEILGRLLEKHPDLVAGKLSFMTVGGIVQFPAGDPKSKSFQKKVVDLCSQSKIDWVDLGARTDGACFSCVHPFSVMSEQAHKEVPDLPRLFPVKFFESFSAQGYKELKKDRRNFHFQYLQASELGCGFDYFLYVSGGQRLESHFPKNT